MNNSTQHPSHPRFLAIFWVIAAVIIALLCVLVRIYGIVPQHWSFESSAELERTRRELPLAEARWNSHNITDYEINVKAWAHPTFCGIYENGTLDFTTPHHLKIQQSEIVFANDSQKRAVEECAIDNFLPPKVFDTIRQSLKTANPKYEYLKVEFDPEYGFVSNYVLVANNRTRSDLNVGYIFTDFRPKEP
jgi:hypothetical protein